MAFPLRLIRTILHEEQFWSWEQPRRVSKHMVLRAWEGRFQKNKRFACTGASFFPQVEVHFFQRPKVALVLTQRDVNFWLTFCGGKPIWEWIGVFVFRRHFSTSVVNLRKYVDPVVSEAVGWKSCGFACTRTYVLKNWTSRSGGSTVF